FYRTMCVVMVLNQLYRTGVARGSDRVWTAQDGQLVFWSREGPHGTGSGPAADRHMHSGEARFHRSPIRSTPVRQTKCVSLAPLSSSNIRTA
uniref:Uncharacterized protein n=1 Tax=Neogobius melanostomus TaxID=47308 RepID=A0A8C6UGQ2_9GOBI